MRGLHKILSIKIALLVLAGCTVNDQARVTSQKKRNGSNYEISGTWLTSCIKMNEESSRQNFISFNSDGEYSAAKLFYPESSDCSGVSVLDIHAPDYHNGEYLIISERGDVRELSLKATAANEGGMAEQDASVVFKGPTTLEWRILGASVVRNGEVKPVDAPEISLMQTQTLFKKVEVKELNP